MYLSSLLLSLYHCMFVQCTAPLKWHCDIYGTLQIDYFTLHYITLHYVTLHINCSVKCVLFDWEDPQDFKDALIVHIYKCKGDRACCDNHRGISLLSIAGKVLGRVILNRLSSYVFGQNIIPESQCGFRRGRGTTDMIYSQAYRRIVSSNKTCIWYLST